ncbi:Crp/Fnr family transcriptional regulator [Streptomyces caniscabiei]|uniref:Crp/Fnr family transcriptional regulator n=1 Tax=Streptomyces caniscabiei TaxID=2746961 RepID=UPI00299FA2BA|nr:Crp/Fnr family transcriptional regulator [Streptomyces caniscabiei]MDX2776490.1 Crp/Fnr family transcriptional regulator [Streptomyces caniscabiei]
MDIQRTPLESLFHDARKKRLDRGQMIFYADDPPTEVAVLVKGIVKVFDIDDKGQEKVLQIIKAPAILPLNCLPTPPRLTKWHYSALTDVDTHVFTPAELHDRIVKSHALSTYIISWLADESHELLTRIDSMSKTDVRAKILAALRFFGMHYTGPDKRGWRQVKFPVTHQLLADITGITRESVTIQMRQLQQEKLIRPKRPYLEIRTSKLLA